MFWLLAPFFLLLDQRSVLPYLVLDFRINLLDPNAAMTPTCKPPDSPPGWRTRYFKHSSCNSCCHSRENVEQWKNPFTCKSLAKMIIHSFAVVKTSQSETQLKKAQTLTSEVDDNFPVLTAIPSCYSWRERVLLAATAVHWSWSLWTLLKWCFSFFPSTNTKTED